MKPMDTWKSTSYKVTHIKVTPADKKIAPSIWINVDHIISFHSSSENTTTLNLSDKTFISITETVDDLVKQLGKSVYG
jgi:competence transcription factor ComK